MVDGAKIGIGLYGRTYGWYGPYGHDQPKTYQVDHLSTFEECAILGHKVYGHDIRTAKSDHVLGDKLRRRACETIQGRKIHLAYSKMPQEATRKVPFSPAHTDQSQPSIQSTRQLMTACKGQTRQRLPLAKHVMILVHRIQMGAPLYADFTCLGYLMNSASIYVFKLLVNNWKH